MSFTEGYFNKEAGPLTELAGAGITSALGKNVGEWAGEASGIEDGKKLGGFVGASLPITLAGIIAYSSSPRTSEEQAEANKKTLTNLFPGVGTANLLKRLQYSTGNPDLKESNKDKLRAKLEQREAKLQQLKSL